MRKKELYFSCDVEADGPIPGVYSMLSLGAAAFDPTRKQKLVATYEATLETLPGAMQDPDTMAWWSQPRNQDAWKKARANPQPPAQVMREFVDWVNTTCGSEYTPVFVAYPAGFDHPFVRHYCLVFAGEDPFGFSALDLKTFAMSKLKCPFREATKRRMPKEWFQRDQAHSHVAVEDAIEQGYLLMGMLESDTRGT